jgi:hypothetical protein
VAPESEDWVGWCKDVAEYKKEKEDWILDQVRYHEDRACVLKEDIDLYKDQVQLYQEMALLCDGNQIHLHEEMVRFHEDRASVHQDEVRKRKRESCSSLGKSGAHFHEKWARVHQKEARECERMADYIGDAIRYYEEGISHYTDEVCCDEGKAFLYREMASWHKAAVCGDVNLILLKEFHAREVNLIAYGQENNVRREQVKAYGDEATARDKEIFVRYGNELDTRGKGFNVRWKELQARPMKFKDRAGLWARRNEIDARTELIQNHGRRLHKHPAVIQRCRLIRFLHNICKLLSKKEKVFLCNEDTSVQPWYHVQVMELVLNWLKSSIFKELGALGIKVIMKTTK